MPIVFSKEGSNAKVSDMRKPSMINHNVFRFDVAMYNIIAVDVPYNFEEDNDNEF